MGIVLSVPIITGSAVWVEGKVNSEFTKGYWDSLVLFGLSQIPKEDPLFCLGDHNSVAVR